MGAGHPPSNTTCGPWAGAPADAPTPCGWHCVGRSVILEEDQETVGSRFGRNALASKPSPRSAVAPATLAHQVSEESLRTTFGSAPCNYDTQRRPKGKQSKHRCPFLALDKPYVRQTAGNRTKRNCRLRAGQGRAGAAVFSRTEGQVTADVLPVRAHLLVPGPVGRCSAWALGSHRDGAHQPGRCYVTGGRCENDDPNGPHRPA